MVEVKEGDVICNACYHKYYKQKSRNEIKRADTLCEGRNTGRESESNRLNNNITPKSPPSVLLPTVLQTVILTVLFSNKKEGNLLLFLQKKDSECF